MPETIVIEGRFNGPPASAHGGYVCGLLARHVEGAPVEVTLRAPPPLDTELELRREGGRIALHDGEQLVAEARAAESLDLEIPAPVSLAEARAAREHSPLHEGSPYATCFVCGPQRPPGDGLRVIAGPVEGRDGVIASPWEPDESLPLEDGAVSPDIVWAALDCPSGCSLVLAPGVGVCMLGRMKAEIHSPVIPGDEYVAIGWPYHHQGRKHLAGTAIFSADGELVAAANGVWIELKDQPQPAG